MNAQANISDQSPTLYAIEAINYFFNEETHLINTNPKFVTRVDKATSVEIAQSILNYDINRALDALEKTQNHSKSLYKQIQYRVAYLFRRMINRKPCTTQ